MGPWISHPRGAKQPKKIMMPVTMTTMMYMYLKPLKIFGISWKKLDFTASLLVAPLDRVSILGRSAVGLDSLPLHIDMEEMGKDGAVQVERQTAEEDCEHWHPLEVLGHGR